MNETFLGVRGSDALASRCGASLLGITVRWTHDVLPRQAWLLPQAEMDIAMVVQRQIAATRSSVMFTIDPSSGRADWIVIEGSFGLGEAVVSGSVSPDRYIVEKRTTAIVTREVRAKEVSIELAEGGGMIMRQLSARESTRPVLSDAELRQLANLAVRIERHYGAPQATEWAFDAEGSVWMLQSRPVTSAGETAHEAAPEPTTDGAIGAPLVRGLGAAPGRGSGPVRVIASLADAARLRDGDVLVTHMTTPDWVPLTRRAVGIVTDSGGMTCHAAIVSRELGVPCVVGTAVATHKLRDGELVTVDAAHGVVHRGAHQALTRRVSMSSLRPSALPWRRRPAPSCWLTYPSLLGRARCEARRRRRRPAAGRRLESPARRHIREIRLAARQAPCSSRNGRWRGRSSSPRRSRGLAARWCQTSSRLPQRLERAIAGSISPARMSWPTPGCFASPWHTAPEPALAASRLRRLRLGARRRRGRRGRAHRR